jgi:TolB-like protein/DNA-binding winged helix-turn-helix (wHTH) protein/Tfp pilus assembly protein PilF
MLRPCATLEPSSEETPINFAAERRTISFGVFEVDLRSGELRKNGSRVKLQEKPFQILAVLLDRPGELVTREELQKRLWPADTIVDFDHSLGTAIGKLRQALGDSAHNPRFVETLGGRGYRFIAPVADSLETPNPPNMRPVASYPMPAAETTEAVSRKGARRPGKVWPIGAAAAVLTLVATLIVLNVGGWRDQILPTSRPADIRSLAVLPFENLSHDLDQEYFADGMTDELITNLGKIGALRVISRTSVMSYKGTRKPLAQIARDLNVDGVVEGTVLRSGERVRITAQLIRVNPERHLWAESYERDLRDVLALQEDVVHDIAREVRIKLTPQERALLSNGRPVNPEAQEAYLRGVYFWNKRTTQGFEKSIEYFNQAIRKEPSYALAYAGLANAYNMLGAYGYSVPREIYPKAHVAALKALALDDTSGEAHAALGLYKSVYEWDQPGADRELRRAIELDPGYAFAHIWRGEGLSIMERHWEAVAELDRARELDPTSLMVSDQRGWVLYMARRYDDAIEQIRKTVELEPRFAHAHCWLGKVYLQKGMVQGGLAELKDAASLPGGDSQLYAPWLGYAYALSGKRAEALKVVETMKAQEQKSHTSPFGIAVIYCGLEQKGQALAWLEKAYQERDPHLPEAKIEPAFDPLRSDAHFQHLVGRSSLPPEER